MDHGSSSDGKRRSRKRSRASVFAWMPSGDLERIRNLNRKCAGWVDEWDFIREAVRRRLEEFREGYPTSHA
jgi:hypothetical protein